MDQLCYIDTETRSAVPIQHGTANYTRAAECIIITFKLAGRPTRLVDVIGPHSEPGAEAELLKILADPSISLIAQNAAFDRMVLALAAWAKQRGVTIALERWQCTMAQAYAHGLPGSLELLGVVLGLDDEQQKMDQGKALIPVFCIPKNDGTYITPQDRPEQWKEFCDYAVRDTDALAEIHKRLPTHNYRDENLALWHLDQRINERGFYFDQKLARRCVEFLKAAKEKSDAGISQQTGGAVTAATQRQRLLNYLNDKYTDLGLPNLRAAEIRSMLEQDDLHAEVRFLLEARLEGAKSSGSKYRRGLQIVDRDSRIKFSIQYAAAGRTGRFGGRGFQPHNMPLPRLNTTRADGRIVQVMVKAQYIDEVVIPGIYSGEALNNDLAYGGPNEACAMALRHAIRATPGNVLVVADWKNIESRILAWIADEVWKLTAYRAADRGEGADLYKLLFSQFFGGAVDDVTEQERQSGKVSELAFGFGGGVGALVTMAAAYQMDLSPLAQLVLPRATPDQLIKAEKAWRRAFLLGEDYALEPAVFKACDVLKQTYRTSNARINKLRYDVDNAVKAAVKNPGRSIRVARCRIWSSGTWLIIELPSGRRILYSNPRIERDWLLDPETGEKRATESVSYATARGRTWLRERAWSGLFIENIVQAIAADILRTTLLRIDAATAPFFDDTPIVLHVHDEVVLDVGEGEITLDQLMEWMTEPFPWSDGLPLAASGWTGPVYGKR